jgi:hypothetical protein
MEWKKLECMCTPPFPPLPSLQPLDNSASGIIVRISVFVIIIIIISHLLTDAICHTLPAE